MQTNHTESKFKLTMQLFFRSFSRGKGNIELSFQKNQNFY